MYTFAIDDYVPQKRQSRTRQIAIILLFALPVLCVGAIVLYLLRSPTVITPPALAFAPSRTRLYPIPEELTTDLETESEIKIDWSDLKTEVCGKRERCLELIVELSQRDRKYHGLTDISDAQFFYILNAFDGHRQIVANIVGVLAHDSRIVALCIENNRIVPQLIELLSDDDFCDEAASALGNIAADGDLPREYCLKCGIMRPLLKAISENAQSTVDGRLRWLAWLLENLTIGSKDKDNDFDGILAVCDRILTHKDVIVVQSMTNTLVNYCTSDNFCRKLMKNTNALSLAIDNLKRIELIDSSLTSIGKILTLSEFEERAIEFGLLHELNTLIQGEHKIRALTVLTIASTVRTRQSIIDSGILGTIPCFISSDDIILQRNALWTLSNLCVTDIHYDDMHMLDALLPLQIVTDLLKCLNDKRLANDDIEHALNVLIFMVTVGNEHRLDVAQSIRKNRMYRQVAKLAQRNIANVSEKAAELNTMLILKRRNL